MRRRHRLACSCSAALVAVVMAMTALPALASDLRPEVVTLRAELDAARAEVIAASERATVLALELAQREEERSSAAAAHELAEAALTEAVGARQEAEVRAQEAAEESARRERALSEQVRRVLDVAGIRDRQADDLRALAVEAWKGGGDTARAVGMVDALLTARDMGSYLAAMERLGFGADRTGVMVAETSELLDRELAVRERAAVEAQVARRLARRAAELLEERVAAEAERREESALAALSLEATEVALEQATDELAAAEAERERSEATVLAVRAMGGRVRHLAGAPGPGRLSWPTDGRATSGFGSRLHPIFQEVRQHNGIDIPAPTGQPVVAAADGVVRTAGSRGGYGLTVVIDHGSGLSTLYGHLSRIDVRVGQRVGEAQRIGAIGSTGQSTGPHLHYEVHVRGRPTDPLGHHGG
jgi:murein DD-endopeptidase MepM/ murein hydrolase activator NlpD